MLKLAETISVPMVGRAKTRRPVVSKRIEPINSNFLFFANKEMIRNGQGIIAVPVEKIGEYFTLLIEYYETGDNNKLKLWLYETSIDGLE